mmetsp:Transcript_22899/g.34116  ORF Transcript_22899/g.34116 Transcript_22899/m.34116 type:complete len:252 (+) Transcript_22899:828-1583(+)
MKSSSNKVICVLIASTSLTAFIISVCNPAPAFFFLSSFSAAAVASVVDDVILKNSFWAVVVAVTPPSFFTITSASIIPGSTPISSISSNTAALVISRLNMATSSNNSEPSLKKSRSSVINAVASLAVNDDPIAPPPTLPSEAVTPKAFHKADSNPLLLNSLAATALPLVALTMEYLYESYLELSFVTFKYCCLGIPIFSLLVGRSIPLYWLLFPPPPPPLSSLMIGGTLSSGPDKSSYISSYNSSTGPNFD